LCNWNRENYRAIASLVLILWYLSYGFVTAILKKKGKSGGYRLIYYVQTSTGIILLTIYAKSEQVDIAAEEIQEIIEEYQQGIIEDESLPDQNATDSVRSTNR
jgi:hypothetical protein